MRGSIEYYLLMITLMFAMLLSVDFISVIYRLHEAHSYRDQIVSLIENYDGDLDLVYNVLNTRSVCKSCVYEIKQIDRMFDLSVEFSLSISVLDLQRPIRVYGMTVLT